MPGICGSMNGFGRCPKVEVGVAQIEFGGPVKLATSVFSEIDLKDDLRPWTRTSGRRIELKSLCGLRKECELVIGKKMYSAGLCVRALNDWIGCYRS